MRLEKYHGLGNDFLILLDPGGRRPVDAALARALCDRRRGVGADGLIRVTAGGDGADVAMELRNADGSRAETSGNGLRCLARAVVDAGLVAGPEVRVATDAGPRTAWTGDDAVVRVDMGPMRVDDDDGRWNGVVSGRAAFVDAGNPHLVVVVTDHTTVDLAAEAAAVERSGTGPVNVELVSAAPGGRELGMRVWERGVGETPACGSGACAAAAAAHRWGLVGERVTVHQPGGDVEVDLGGESAVLAGPAERVCSVEVPWA